MSRFTTVFLLAFVVAFSYFAFYNPGSMTINLLRGKVIELPVAGVVLFSMAAGASLVLFLALVRGLRRTYGNLMEGARKRRRAKALELYERGVDAHLSGKTEEAYNLLRGALDKDPDFLFPNFRLGAVLLEKGMAEEAIELHRAVIARHPDNLRLKFLLVDDYLAAGRSADATQVLKELIARDDSNRSALTMLRNLQEEEEQWEAAVDTQRKLTRAHGQSADSVLYSKGLRCQWAASLIAEGQHDRAIKVLKDVIKEDPRFVPSLVALGEAYLAQGKVGEGVKVLSRGYSQHQNPAFLQSLEERLLEREEPQRLVEAFRSLLGARPQDLFLIVYYSKVCLRLEMVDEGFMVLKRAEALGYDSSLLHALLGEFNARRERFAEAASDFSRAMTGSECMEPQFTCSVCSQASRRWELRCWSCGSFNSFVLPTLPEPRIHPAAAPQYESEE